MWEWDFVKIYAESFQIYYWTQFYIFLQQQQQCVNYCANFMMIQRAITRLIYILGKMDRSILNKVVHFTQNG